MTTEKTNDAPKFKAGDLAHNEDLGLVVVTGDLGDHVYPVKPVTDPGRPWVDIWDHHLRTPTRLELQAHGLLEDVGVGDWVVRKRSRGDDGPFPVEEISSNGLIEIIKRGAGHGYLKSYRLATPQELHDHGIIDTIPEVPRCACGEPVALCGGAKCVEEAQAMLTAIADLCAEDISEMTAEDLRDELREQGIDLDAAGDQIREAVDCALDEVARVNGFERRKDDVPRDANGERLKVENLVVHAKTPDEVETVRKISGVVTTTDKNTSAHSAWIKIATASGPLTSAQRQLLAKRHARQGDPDLRRLVELGLVRVVHSANPHHERGVVVHFRKVGGGR